jgi:hypothetical protein
MTVSWVLCFQDSLANARGCCSDVQVTACRVARRGGCAGNFNDLAARGRARTALKRKGPRPVEPFLSICHGLGDNTVTRYAKLAPGDRTPIGMGSGVLVFNPL